MHRGSWDLKEFSSLSFCKANNHPLKSLVQVSFFIYWLCWKWGSLAFIKKPTYTHSVLTQRLEEQVYCAWSLSNTGGGVKQKLVDAGEQTEPQKTLHEATSASRGEEGTHMWTVVETCRRGQEDGHSILDLCTFFWETVLLSPGEFLVQHFCPFIETYTFSLPSFQLCAGGWSAAFCSPALQTLVPRSQA